VGVGVVLGRLANIQAVGEGGGYYFAQHRTAAVRPQPIQNKNVYCFGSVEAATVGLNGQQFWVKFCNFYYCVHRIIFYEELPEVKIVSKITLHEKAFLQVFALKFFVKYFPYKFFRINGPPP
jgi:hypothetical protein